jgi:integrase
MPLAKAREIARMWREDIRQGIDPKRKEKELRRVQEQSQARTFAAVFSLYADDHLSTLKTGQDAVKAVERHAFRPWGERPIATLKRLDVLELIRIVRKDAPVAANRLLAYLKTFFAWAVDQELIEASPAASVKHPAKELRRDRVLSEPEIAAIWQACGSLGAFGRAFKLMLITGARRSEVGAMTWREVNLAERLWILPRERTKASRALEVPLPDLALSVLAECPELGEFIFTINGTRPVTGWSRPKRILDKVLAESGTEIAPWHVHDLRRTCATRLARLGISRVVIGKILNHAEPG